MRIIIFHRYPRVDNHSHNLCWYLLPLDQLFLFPFQIHRSDVCGFQYKILDQLIGLEHHPISVLSISISLTFLVPVVEGDFLTPVEEGDFFAPVDAGDFFATPVLERLGDWDIDFLDSDCLKLDRVMSWRPRIESLSTVWLIPRPFPFSSKRLLWLPVYSFGSVRRSKIAGDF